MQRVLGILVGVLLAGSGVLSAQSDGLELLILHNNDMHARFEETNQLSGTCKPNDTCYGGFARVAHVVREARQNATSGKGPSVLYLNAGDTYQGTPWFALYKWNITSRFMNALSPDVMSLGNHEFDNEVAGLIPFLNRSTFPILASNLDLSKLPSMESEKQLMKSVVLEVKGVKVGVIGYLTPTTKELAVSNDVEYYDEVPSINKEAALLKAQGVNILIALGHSGYEMDQVIAKECPDIDLVVGGHTNTFLWTGKQPDSETPEGPYPVVVTQPSGRKVPVVQAYAYTKYFGKLRVQFDKDGEVIEYDGQPLILHESIKQDQDILDLLEVYRPGIDALTETVVAKTKVFLDGSRETCCNRECNMGNLITDSMIYIYVQSFKGPMWSDASISFTVGGGIKSSIDSKNRFGDITTSDALSVLPYDNSLIVASYKGENIKEALEWSVHGYGPMNDTAEFLQMSGVKVLYNIHNQPGNRVEHVQVLCTNCEVPAYEELDLHKIYKIVIPKFMKDGGDGYNVLRDKAAETTILPDNDYTAFLNYIKQLSPVYPVVEGRIQFVEKDTLGESPRFTINILLMFVCLVANYLW